MNEKIDKTHHNHYLKSVHFPSFSGSYFHAFRLNMERYSVSLRIQSKCRKIRTRKTPNTDTFQAMNILRLFIMKTDNVALCCYVNTVLT